MTNTRKATLSVPGPLAPDHQAVLDGLRSRGATFKTLTSSHPDGTMTLSQWADMGPGRPFLVRRERGTVRATTGPAHRQMVVLVNHRSHTFHGVDMRKAAG